MKLNYKLIVRIYKQLLLEIKYTLTKIKQKSILFELVDKAKLLIFNKLSVATDSLLVQIC